MTAPTRSGTPAALAAVVGFFAAAVLPRATWPLIDGDVWWHIRAGEEVLRSGRVPNTDSWSIVAAGQPWTSQDWLANALLAAGNGLGPWGLTLLSFLFGAFTLAAFWILWRAMAQRQPAIGWAGRVIWLSIGLVLAGPVMGVRVQVLDLLLATAVIWVLWRYQVDPRRRWLAALPVIAALWANLHAGWVLPSCWAARCWSARRWTGCCGARQGAASRWTGPNCATWRWRCCSAPRRSPSTPTAWPCTSTRSTRWASPP
jgi:hypothetical protein